MGRGSSESGANFGSGAGANPANIKNVGDMLSTRETKTAEVDAVLTVSRDMNEQFGTDVDFILADITGKDSNTMAFYSGNQLGWNRRYFDTKAQEKAYDDCVKSGFHPSRGNKTAMEAVAAHEFGHAVNDKAAAKMGLSFDNAAKRIINEAKKSTSHSRGADMAAKISRYALESQAEAIAEAFADVYCNGKRAKSESHAIVNTTKKYL